MTGYSVDMEQSLGSLFKVENFGRCVFDVQQNVKDLYLFNTSLNYVEMQ